MPYVQRDHKGNIIGLYALPQEPQDWIPVTEADPLPDDHPEVVAFRRKMEALFGPRSSPAKPNIDEMKRLAGETKHLEQEHETIKRAVTVFNSVFGELEIALSALLYAILNLRHSRVAYAIYFSPTSFDARTEIVDNALTQIVAENDELKDLLPLWKRVHEHVASTRRLRNALAHGVQQTLAIRGKNYARFSPLAFDVIRLGRPIANRQIPGLTAKDISTGAKDAQTLRDQIDITNRIITAFYDGDPTWRKRCDALQASLRKARSQ